MFKNENASTTIFLIVMLLLGVLAAGGSWWSKKASPAPSLEAPSIAFDESAQPSAGDPSAPVSIKVFYDYQCPHCKQWEEQVFPVLQKTVLADKTAQLTYVNFAFMGAASLYKAIAAEVMHDQQPDQFLAFHNYLFEHQNDLDTKDMLAYLSEKTGLSAKEIDTLMNDPVYRSQVRADTEHAQSLNVSSTPTVFVNGKPLKNGFDLEEMQAALNDALAASSSKGVPADEASSTP